MVDTSQNAQAWIQQQLAENEDRRCTLMKALEVLAEFSAAQPEPEPDSPVSQSDNDTQTPQDWVGLADLDIDLTGATSNLLDRLLRIAEVTGGRLHTVETANWMVNQGHSSAKVKNLRSNIHHKLGGHEDFVKIAPNFFAYTPVNGNLMTVPSCAEPPTTI